MTTDLYLHETENALTEKIKDLFHICDTENKGFATRQDLYRLKNELGLTDYEVENGRIYNWVRTFPWY